MYNRRRKRKKKSNHQPCQPTNKKPKIDPDAQNQSTALSCQANTALSCQANTALSCHAPQEEKKTRHHASTARRGDGTKCGREDEKKTEIKKTVKEGRGDGTKCGREDERKTEIKKTVKEGGRGDGVKCGNDVDDGDEDWVPDSKKEDSGTEDEDDAPTTDEDEKAGGSSGSSAEEEEEAEERDDGDVVISGDDDDDDGELDDDDEKEETKTEGVVTGRRVADRVLRLLPQDRKSSADADTLRLKDLANEFLLLDEPQGSDKRHFAACIKGRVYLAGDRILLDNQLLELTSFGQSSSQLSSSSWVEGRWLVDGVPPARHGNYIRIEPPARLTFTSDTILVPAVASPANTVKISHSADLKVAPLSSASAADKLIDLDKSLVLVVAGDKGRSRPALFTAEKRWNAGEQKRLLMFLRRVWPTLERPATVTIPMVPPPHRDNLLAEDDNDGGSVADMKIVTARYKALWQTVCNKGETAADCQRWLANTFDTWRRFYIQVRSFDWETAFRELAATNDLILNSYYRPPNS